jgi:hypothetical protein
MVNKLLMNFGRRTKMGRALKLEPRKVRRPSLRVEKLPGSAASWISATMPDRLITIAVTPAGPFHLGDGLARAKASPFAGRVRFLPRALTSRRPPALSAARLMTGRGLLAAARPVSWGAPTRGTPTKRPYVIQSDVVTAFAAGGREYNPGIFGIGAEPGHHQ